MPHVVIEYSANLRDRLDLSGLIDAVHHAVLSTGTFRIGGVRIRAYAAESYLIADGHSSNAFIHFTLKVGFGRGLDELKRVCEVASQAACEFLAPLFDEMPFAISLEMQEIDQVLTFKKNNLHEYIRRRRTSGVGGDGS